MRLKQAPSMRNKRRDLIVYFLKGSVRFFALSIGFAMLASFFDLLSPRVVGWAVDSFLAGDDRAVRSALTVAAVAGAGAIFRYLYRLFNSMGAEKLVERMRNRLFEHIERLKFSWYSENQTGDIIQRCTSDVETVKSFLSDQLTSVFRIVIMILIAMGFMISINWKLAIVAAVFIPAIFLYSLFFHGRIGSTFQEADEEEGTLSTITQENLTGVRVVRAFGRERYERRRFEHQNDIYTAAYLKLSILISAFWSMGDFFAGAQVMAVVAVGAYLAVKGQITAGDYIAFISYNSMLSWPVRSLGRVISDMSKAGVSVDRIGYIMNSKEEEDPDRAIRPAMDRDIAFSHVSFRYGPDMPKILDDVSFTIPAGKTVGILGGTGSGKSTLMYLLDRLYDIGEGSGSITIGGVDIRDIPRDYLRDHIGMVLQEPFLFSRSLSENIGIAADDAGQPAIERAAGIASLSETVRHFRHGYDTMVGERGMTLSGGQKQRTAIAQMVIRDTPIMIFDDSLSAVDAETDARIRVELNRCMGNATIVLISHRITTLMAADEIVVLNHGRVTETGTHEELLKKQGLYARICGIQGIAAETKKGGDSK